MPEREIGYVVKVIFLVLVLFIVIFGIISWNVSDKFRNLFPDFGRGEIVVNWDEDVFLEHPEMMVIQYNDGKWSGDVIGFGIGDL